MGIDIGPLCVQLDREVWWFLAVIHLNVAISPRIHLQMEIITAQFELGHCCE
jgi:hypothetical protein